jgi:hypothetical protein
MFAVSLLFTLQSSNFRTKKFEQSSRRPLGQADAVLLREKADPTYSYRTTNIGAMSNPNLSCRLQLAHGKVRSATKKLDDVTVQRRQHLTKHIFLLGK